MHQRTFGTTGVEASVVGFGVWTLATGRWGEHTDETAVELLRAAHAAGVTFYDTADADGEGRGERLLARAFAGRRGEVTLATKFGYDVYAPWGREGHGARPHDWSPGFARFALEQSLERLGTDHVDVWQLHDPRLDALRSDRLWDEVEKARDEGLVRAVGVSLGPAIGWRDEGGWALRNRRVDALQVTHHLLERDPGRELLELANEQGVGVMVRLPDASGLLERLRFLETRGRTRDQAAILWLLADAAVTTVLPDISGPERLRELAAAPGCEPLDAAELARVAELYARGFDVTSLEA